MYTPRANPNVKINMSALAAPGTPETYQFKNEIINDNIPSNRSNENISRNLNLRVPSRNRNLVTFELKNQEPDLQVISRRIAGGRPKPKFNIEQAIKANQLKNYIHI
jgi:hypothetical protein